MNEENLFERLPMVGNFPVKFYELTNVREVKSVEDFDV
jgi:hypothetical protein